MVMSVEEEIAAGVREFSIATRLYKIIVVAAVTQTKAMRCKGVNVAITRFARRLMQEFMMSLIGVVTESFRYLSLACTHGGG
jgi:hypothetical protein